MEKNNFSRKSLGTVVLGSSKSLPVQKWWKKATKNCRSAARQLFGALLGRMWAGGLVTTGLLFENNDATDFLLITTSIGCMDDGMARSGTLRTWRIHEKKEENNNDDEHYRYISEILWNINLARILSFFSNLCDSCWKFACLGPHSCIIHIFNCSGKSEKEKKGIRWKMSVPLKSTVRPTLELKSTPKGGRGAEGSGRPNDSIANEPIDRTVMGVFVISRV